MITNFKKHHRCIATFFLLIFFPTLLPNNLFASTNGPVAPEATSFEPIDATDMVNLTTGDLSYVLPLLDVPSPEGGYPLTLAYHAGIATDQDASWVGLGWNINPGAINRSISGFPDDWKEGKVSSIVYDSGGEIATHSFSIGVGWGDGKYSVGLYGSYSENKAFSGQNSYNFDGGVYAGVGDVQGRIGSDGVGLGLSNSFDYKLGTQSVNGNYSVGINHSFKTGGTTFSLSADSKMNSIGSSEETKFNGSVGVSSANYLGSNRDNNNSSYSMAQVGDNVIVNFQIYLLRINYSYSKIRYWLFDKKSYSGVGSLFAENITNVRNNSLFENEQGFDTYTVSEDQTDESLLGNNIVLPAYDFYSVSAQGIAGDISPKIFEYGTLTPKNSNVNKEGKNYRNFYLGKNSFTKKIDNNNIHFYFNNTNESYLDIDSSIWGTTPLSLNSSLEANTISSPLSTMKSSLTIDGVNCNGYSSINSRKKGASYIETYTNNQIIANPSLVYKINNFNRNVSSIPKDGIGAFKITAADGKTYHYSIPVYQNEKFARSAKYEEDIDNKFYEEYQTDSYATHWLLTAITGSDFVDNGDGVISDKDLGYFVTFEYGKWSDGYTWRTPRADFKTTPTSKIYEWGVKEIYYLNAIKTRTHTAFFIKSERQDGKSIPHSMDKEYSSTGVTINISDFSNKDNAWHVKGLGFDSPAMTLWEAAGTYALHKVKMNYNKSEHKVLKLDRIILVKNKDVPLNFRYSNPNEKPSTLKCVINISEYLHIFRGDGSTKWKKDYTPIYNSSRSGEYYSNVLDNADISYYFPNIESVSSKIIEFSQDYSLAKGTPNTTNSTEGRLTLNKLTYKGKKGIQVLPPYSFEYENPTQTYDINNTDDWGFNKGAITSWNLKKIKDPNGANILVSYEEDDYYTEAVNYKTIIKNGLKFVFYEFLGKLRFDVKNLNESNVNKVDFSSFFNLNQKAKVNVWASVKHEYNDWGCKHRDANVDINDELVDVVAVNSTQVTFETDLNSHLYNNNNGFSWLIGPEFSYEMDRLQRDKKRGESPVLSGGCSERTAYVLYYSLNSNKILKDQNGGGLRVKQIVVNSEGENYNTNYYYNQDGFSRYKGDSNYKSSGITSYAPSKYEKNIKYMAELPPPNVLYKLVTVETDQDINKYYFKTLSPEVESIGEYSIDDILHIKKGQSQDNIPVSVSGWDNCVFSKYKYEVENNFSMIGALLKHEKYNKYNHLLKRVENNYKPTSNILQGLTKETFNSYKISFYRPNYESNSNGTIDLNVSSKTTYPSVLQSVRVFEGGVVNSVFYDKYDFFTGQILETTNVSSNGQSFKTKIVPAYTKQEYNPLQGYGMGSKVDNPTNKNMLSQIAAQYSYILDKSSNAWKETGVGITTWSNLWNYRDVTGAVSSPAALNEKVWRKHKTFTWNGSKDSNGIFLNYGANDDGFNWNLPTSVGIDVSQPAHWKQLSETTLYDHFSAPLEIKDINGNYAATKMGDNNTKIMVTGNAGYNEMFYCGAENTTDVLGVNWLEPDIKMTNATRTNRYVHSGKLSVEATSSSEFGVLMKSNEHRTGKYKVSVWVHKSSVPSAALYVNNNVIPFTESYTAGNWVLKSAIVNFNKESSYTINVKSINSTAVYLDDLMIRPVSSTISGYVYNEWDELTHIIGNNGLATRFEYDAAGRLIRTYVEVLDDVDNGISGGFKLKSVNKINYKGLTQ